MAAAAYRAAAERGDATAMFGLGQCYRNGQGVTRDAAQAVAWYRRAADNRNVTAMNQLGDCYEHGTGVAQDLAQASVLYRMAAEKGETNAMHSLGVSYAYGKGVPLDYAQAVSWFKRAADGGNALGLYSLGWCYENGYGVNKDTAEAVSLFSAYNAANARPLNMPHRGTVTPPQANAASASISAAERRAAERRAADQLAAGRLATEQAQRAGLVVKLHELARSGNAGPLGQAEFRRVLQEPNEDGNMAIHEAAAYNQATFIESLRTRGVPIDARSQSGRTALHEAARKGHTATVKYLLSRGAIVDPADRHGNTPVLLAVTDGHYNVAHVLAEAGAALDAARADGRTCLDLVRDAAPDQLGGLVAIQSRRNFDRQLMHEVAVWDRVHSHRYASTIDTTPTTNAIRDGRLSLLTAPPPSGPMHQLYTALICVSSSVFTAAHTEKALQTYEAEPGEKSPLLLLAHARNCAKKSGTSAHVLRIGLLRRFAQIPGATSWLTQEENAAIAGPPQSDGGPITLQPDVGGGNVSTETETRWQQVASRLTAAQRKPMDDLLSMIGLTEVKRIALQLYTDVLRDKDFSQRGISPVPRTLNFAFVGNPGTGKTVCAKLFSELLEQAGARAGHKFVNMTASEALRKGSKAFASELASLTGGVAGVGPPPKLPLRRNMNVEIDIDGKLYPGIVNAVDVRKNVYEIKYADGTIEEDVPYARVFALGQKGKIGGVLFLDEAYDLDPQSNSEGRLILADIMQAAEEHRDTVSIILAGYKDDIERKLYAFNSGMPSRFQTVVFEDFNEGQLANIWRKFCSDHKWTASPETTRVVARRLARGAGKKGFGNARTVRKLFYSATSAAANAPTLSVEDVIGLPPTPENVPELKSALRDLDALTGIPKVKLAILKIVALAQSNYRKELAAEEITHISLNRLLVGNPGCGKTTVAAIYGRILKSLRLLSNGEVVLKTASDFVGDVVGASQNKTRQILDAAEGRVLVVDEAYNLDDQLYGKQALDTIVEKVMGDPGEDIAVLMLGYKAQIQKMLRDQNPGLARRFQPHNMLEFEDFADEDLARIFLNGCSRMGITSPLDVTLYAVKRLAQQRNLPNFGNAGAVKTLLANAKLSMDSRDAVEMDRRDLDANADIDPEHVLRELAGYGAIEDEMRRLGSCIRVRQEEGRSLDGLVNNFVFTGAPGTGKTTVARAIAKLLYAYRVLASDQVIETSGANLTGAFVGKAKELVLEKMQAARGGVLFIDEAYQLGEGSYGREAVAALVELLTLPEYANGKTVVVMAGYHGEIHNMMEGNPGLKSRFRKYVEFADWDARRAADFVLERISKVVPVDEPDDVLVTLWSGFEEILRRPGWANGRDALNLSELLLQHRDTRVARDGLTGVISTDAEAAVSEMLASRPSARQTSSRVVASAPVAAIEAVVAAPQLPLSGTATSLQSDQVTPSQIQQLDQTEDGGEIGDAENAEEHVPSGTWNGMDIERELSAVNAVVQRWAKERLDSLRDGDGEVLRDLTSALLRNGVDVDEAKRMARKYVEALNELRRQEFKARQREAELRRRPIIQCQVCRRTGNYWAPCWVAPKLIGWEPAEVIEPFRELV